MYIITEMVYNKNIVLVTYEKQILEKCRSSDVEGINNAPVYQITRR